jgi:hypothetical protein
MTTLGIQLPAPVKIGRHTVAFALIHPEEADNAKVWGYYDPYGNRIVLDAGISGLRAVEVTIHELTHALFHLKNVNPRWGEEKTVTALGLGWANLLRDNPHLLLWIVAHVLKTNKTEVLT